MKKITAMMLSLISVNAFATVTVISEEHYSSPGFKDSNVKVIETERTLSPEEMDDATSLSAEKKTLMAKSLIAKVNNATGKVNAIIPIYSDQQACFKNTTSSDLQFGYRFNLEVMRDNRLDAKTFFLSSGQEMCFKRTGFMNFQAGSPGKWQVVATTRGDEGGSSSEVKGYATLTITN